MELRRPKHPRSTPGRRGWARGSRSRLGGIAGAAVLFGASFVGRADEGVRISPHLHSFMRDMPRTVRADHPAIVPVAAAICTVTTNPLEQLVMVNDVAHLLVDYDDDRRVYGQPEYYATFDEMLAKRREQGWLYLRDDCDGRAVFAAHLLAALGIPWRLEASYWKRHAWVVARVGGVDYDLLDFHPRGSRARISYRLVGHWFVRKGRQPPAFDWRQRWSERTRSDLATGLRLGLLAVDSTPGHLRERHATDWMEQSPRDLASPADPRERTAPCAGFPFGELLRTREVAEAPTLPPMKAPTASAMVETLPAPNLAANSTPASPATR